MHGSPTLWLYFIKKMRESSASLAKIWFERKPLAESNISRVREKRLPSGVEMYVVTEAEIIKSDETKVSYANVMNLFFFFNVCHPEVFNTYINIQ
jgi:hypothetical protein